MFRSLLAAAFTALALPALAQQPVNLLPPREPAPVMSAPIADKPPVEEPAPSFEPIRPAAPDAAPPAPEPPPPPAVQLPPVAPPAILATPEPIPAPPTIPAPPPVPTPIVAAPPPVADVPAGLPIWASGLLILAGAFLAGLFGMATAGQARRAEYRARRRAVVATLATELETRRLALDSVPLPPNVDAGVSFVSSVISLANIDAGYRSAQFDVNLLPEKLASHVSVHYAAVQRVADFVKGQSMAAAVRMLQANRLGGHPCPDAGAMREAHVELSAAFRGIDKLISALRGLS